MNFSFQKRSFLGMLHALCGKIPAASTYRLNNRLFNSINRGEDVKQQQEEESRKSWKEKQLKKPKYIRKFTPKNQFDNGRDTGLAAGFKNYLENVILATIEEKKVVLAREKLLNSNLPNDLLELRGLALISLALDTSFMQVSDGKNFEVKLVREGTKCLPDGGWRRGMLVTLELEGIDGFCSSDVWRRKNGVLVDVGSQWVVVSLDNLDSWVLETLTAKRRMGGVRVVKRSEDGIYNRNLDMLKNLMKKTLNFKETTPQGYIFSNVLELDEIHCPESSSTDNSDISPPNEQNLVIFNQKLLTDSSKQSALTVCSSCPPVAVIHGPPGTGKTTTLAAAVLSAVANGEKVLVVAPSHAACDAFTAAVAEYWPGGKERRGKLVRLGSKLRLTTKEVEKFLPENIAKSDILSDIENKIRIVRSELVKGGRGRGSLVQEEANLVSEHNDAHKELEDEVIGKALVVVCTIMTASRNHIQRMMSEGCFSLVCVDEAGFTLDSQLVPLVARAKRIVLAGDHLQLPPVVLSQEGKDRGLDISLLERLAKHCPESVTMLSTQYRSHHDISDWSSQHFYGGNLVANEFNSEQLLNQIVNMKNVTRQERIWTDSPMMWMDSKDCNWEEQSEDDDSISNCDEAVMVTDIVSRFLQLGVKQEMIGVISPYWAQVALIRSLVWEGDGKTSVEVRTVDGYQGREKEVILLSMVRSNPEGVVGFLSESRRVNVSVTRAKRCCIIIGDSGTLRSDQGLDSLWRFCQQRKLIRGVREGLV